MNQIVCKVTSAKSADSVLGSLLRPPLTDLVLRSVYQLSRYPRGSVYQAQLNNRVVGILVGQCGFAKFICNYELS